MNQSELMNLLGIKPGAVKAPTPVAKQTITVSLPQSETVLDLDAWDLEKGEELSDKFPRVTIPPEAWADFYGAAFLSNPEVNPSAFDKVRETFIKTLLETSEYKALHTSTQGNPLASETAAISFVEQYVKLAGKPKKRPRDTIIAIGEALQEASKEIEAMEDACIALGVAAGTGPGNKTEFDGKRILSIFNKVKDNASLRKIINLAGRFRRFAQGKQRNKVTHGYDDMIGVVQDGDVGRLLPQELAQLADPIFEMDAMRRLVERQSLSRHYKGSEKVGKGPIIVCVDESGSMRSRDKIAYAKAFALAMAWVARHQKRYCVLIGYSGGSEGTLLTLPPGKWDESKLVEWLVHFYDGGTEMDVPLQQLPTSYWSKINAPKGKVDLVIITDGIVNVPKTMELTFNEWKKKEKVRCISLILEHSYRSGGLAGVSDETHNIPKIDTDVLAIQECLAI